MSERYIKKDSKLQRNSWLAYRLLEASSSCCMVFFPFRIPLRGSDDSQYYDQINQIWDESKSILLDDGTQYVLSLGIRVYEKHFHSLFWAVRELLCEAIKCFTSRLYYLGSRTYVATRISTAFIPIPTHPFNVL